MIFYLFDIDGTLVHAHGSGRAAFDAVLAAQHGITDACAGIKFGGQTDPALVDEIFRVRLERAPTAAEHAAFLDAYVPRLRTELARFGVDVIGGVLDALAFLAARHDVRLTVASGNVRAGAEAKLELAGLTPWFAIELGGYGCDSAVRAELVGAAIARARAVHGEPREVVVVGDTVRDIAAARACGATVCAVTTGSDSADALAHADVVLASLTELPAWHAARFG